MDQLVSFHSEGLKLFGNLCKPNDGAPCVLLSHGLESSKDGDKWLIPASRLMDKGFSSLRFSYRGCGMGPERSEGDSRYSTLTQRTKDYNAAIDYLHTRQIDTNRLGVIGSSFGGMVALAAHDPRVKTLVCLATPSRMPEMLGGVATTQKNMDRIEFEGGRLPRSIYEDAQNYDICQAMRQITCPILFVHGSADDVVPAQNARDLYHCAAEPKRLVIVEGGNHSFDEPDHLERVVVLALEWLGKYL